MKIRNKLLLIFIVGLFVGCSDSNNESTGQPVMSDTASVPASESNTAAVDDSGDPLSGDSEVPATDDSEVPVIENSEVPVTDDSEVPATDDSKVPVTDDSEVPATDDSKVPVTDNSVTPDAGSTCIDLVSSNADWSDNCVLSTHQPYSGSTYLLGVQRILWCVEAFSDATLTIEQSTDGVYVGKTEEAVRRYQRRHALTNNGSVDAPTWIHLQQELILVGAAASEYSSFAIAGARCGEQIHFYQRNTPPQDWKIAAQPGSNELLDFSALELEQ